MDTNSLSKRKAFVSQTIAYVSSAMEKFGKSGDIKLFLRKCLKDELVIGSNELVEEWISYIFGLVYCSCRKERKHCEHKFFNFEQKHRTPLPPQGVSEELTEWLLTCLQDFGNMGQIWVKFIDSKPYSVYCSEEHVIDALKLISNISTFKSMPLPLFTNKRERGAKRFYSTANHSQSIYVLENLINQVKYYEFEENHKLTRYFNRCLTILKKHINNKKHIIKVDETPEKSSTTHTEVTIPYEKPMDAYAVETDIKMNDTIIEVVKSNLEPASLVKVNVSITPEQKDYFHQEIKHKTPDDIIRECGIKFWHPYNPHGIELVVMMKVKDDYRYMLKYRCFDVDTWQAEIIINELRYNQLAEEIWIPYSMILPKVAPNAHILEVELENNISISFVPPCKLDVSNHKMLSNEEAVAGYDRIYVFQYDPVMEYHYSLSKKPNGQCCTHIVIWSRGDAENHTHDIISDSLSGDCDIEGYILDGNPATLQIKYKALALNHVVPN